MWLFNKLYSFLKGLGERGEVKIAKDPPADDPPQDDPPVDDPPADDPPVDDPPADDPPEPEVIKLEDFTKGEDGVIYYKGTPIVDEKGVSYFNRAMEFKRKTEEGPSKPEPAARPAPKGDMKKSIKERFPGLSKIQDEEGNSVGDDIIDFVVEAATAMSQQTLMPYTPVFADLLVNEQKKKLKDSDPKFSDLEEEVDEILKQFPMQSKLTGAKQVVENAYNMVLGKRSRESAQTAADKARNAALKNKKIVKESHVTSGPSSRKPGKTTLTSKQQKDYEKNYQPQGVTEEGYLEIQKGRPKEKQVK